MPRRRAAVLALMGLGLVLAARAETPPQARPEPRMVPLPAAGPPPPALRAVQAQPAPSALPSPPVEPPPTLPTPPTQLPLRIGLPAAADTLDPVHAEGIAGRSVLWALCDTLIEVDAELRLVPRLATSWEWSADDKVLTLRLRPHVVFHDGEPFDAEAVKFNIDRVLNTPGSRRRAEIGAIERVEVAEPLVARLHLAAPLAPLPARLAGRAGMMVSPRAAAADGTAFASSPVCSGPFTFAARGTHGSIGLARFDRHWDAANVSVARVEFRTIPDPTVRLLDVRNGSLDLVDGVAANDAPSVRRDDALHYAQAIGSGFTAIVINVGNGPGADTPFGRDPRLREAFDLALDREALNQVAFTGANRPGNQPVPPGSPYYHPGFRLRPPDLARARALLADAVQPEPTLRLLAPNATELLQVAEIVQSMAREAGIRLDIEAAEPAAVTRRVAAGDFQALLARWPGRPDPDENIRAFNHCGGGANASGYCDPRVDSALDAARATTDQARRVALYREAAAIFLPARHRIYLFHESWRFAYGSRLRRFQAPPDGIIRIPGLRLD